MFEKILVPLDGSELAECALPYAEELARNAGSEVILVSVTERQITRTSSPEVREQLRSSGRGDIHGGGSPGSVLYSSPSVGSIFGSSELMETSVASGKMEKQAQKYLARLVKSLGAKKVTARMEVLAGNPAKEITDFAEKNDISLIVMASHGRSGPSRWAYGSNADKIFRASCVPILMIRAPGCTLSA